VIKHIILATAVAGTLDLLAAFFFAGQAGMSPAGVLQFVASGPFGDGMLHNAAGTVAGVFVHYGIMACMVAVFMAAAANRPILTARPLVSGVVYGLLLWFVMYWIVRPMRWPDMPLPSKPAAIAGQLFCHVILVGIPIALIAARNRRGRTMTG
jgi:hypothetical protein